MDLLGEGPGGRAQEAGRGPAGHPGKPDADREREAERKKEDGKEEQTGANENPRQRQIATKVVI